MSKINLLKEMKLKYFIILFFIVLIVSIFSSFLPLNWSLVIKLVVGYLAFGFGYIFAGVYYRSTKGRVEVEKKDNGHIYVTTTDNKPIKETVLAYVSCSIGLSDDAYSWLESIPEENRKQIWFNKYSSHKFFQRYEKEFSDIFIKIMQEDINDFFLSQGLERDNLPIIKIYNTKYGSIEFLSQLVFIGSLPAAYEALKAALEFWETSNKTKQILENTSKRIEQKYNELIKTKLEPIASNPPDDLSKSELVIKSDIPYIISSFDNMDKNKTQISVTLSRKEIIICNLNHEDFNLTRLGIFKNYTPQNIWTFMESYKTDPIKITSSDKISLKKFLNNNKEELNIEEKKPLYIDCWLEDHKGIYLIRFLLNPNDSDSNNGIELAVVIDKENIILTNIAGDSSNIKKSIRVGLFKSKTKRTSWYYAESYNKFFNVLKPLKEVKIKLSKFNNSKNEILSIEEETPLGVDCWVEEPSKNICIFFLYLKN